MPSFVSFSDFVRSEIKFSNYLKSTFSVLKIPILGIRRSKYSAQIPTRPKSHKRTKIGNLKTMGKKCAPSYSSYWFYAMLNT